jgi:hypothetical protein
MPIARSARSAVVTALVVQGCTGPGASVEIEDANATRDGGGHVVVDVDVQAHELLGGNVGTYCARVSFSGQSNRSVQCGQDLRDGDKKTVRVVSEGDPDPGSNINIDVQLGTVSAVWDLAAPPR